MPDKPLSSAIRDSYRPATAPKTVAIPVLIAIVGTALLLFYLTSWDPPGTDPEPKPESLSPEPPIADAKPLPISAPAVETTPAAIPILSEPEPAPELPPSESDFTPWMSPLALDTYIRQKNRGYHESFWARGNWIRAIEGRWSNGGREYRIAIASMNHPGEIQWQFRLDLGKRQFREETERQAANGFELIQSQGYKLPDGTLRIQGVWKRKKLP